MAKESLVSLTRERLPDYHSINTSPEEHFPAQEENTFSLFFPIFKKISGIAIPMGLSFTFSFEVFLSVVFLHLLSDSDEDTAAATLVSVVMNTVCMLAIVQQLASGLEVSKLVGAWQEENNQVLNQDLNNDDTRAQKKERIESIHINSLIMASITATPATLTLYFSKFILVTIFRQNVVVAESASKFLRTYAFAVPGLAIRMASEQMLFGLEEARPSMRMALGSLLVGVSLSYLFGFFLEMDKKGVALGFVIEAYLTMLLFGLYLKFNKNCGEFNFYHISIERVRRNLDMLVKLLYLGGAITFSVAIDLIMTLAMGILSGLLGTKAQSAMSYCMQFIYFEFIMLAAFSASCAQEISRKLGADKIEDARNTAKYGFLTTLIYLSPLAIFFAIYPRALEVISGGASEDVSKTLTTLLPVMSAGVILDSARYNLLQQLRAFGDLLFPVIIALFSMLIGVGLATALGFATTMGVDGVAVGYAIAALLATMALYPRWQYIRKEYAHEEPNTRQKTSWCDSLYSLFYHSREDLRLQIERSDYTMPLIGSTNVLNLENYEQQWHSVNL